MAKTHRKKTHRHKRTKHTRRPRTLAGKAYKIAKKALRKVRAIPKLELKYQDAVSAPDTTAAPDDHGTYPLKHVQLPHDDITGELTFSAPDQGGIIGGGYWTLSLCPSINTGVNDHTRIGDRVRTKWVNIRMLLVPNSTGCYRTDTIIPVQWTAGTTGSNFLQSADMVRHVSPCRVRVLIIERPTDNYDTNSGTETRDPRPDDFYEYIDKATSPPHTSLIPYYTNSLRFWFPWTRKIRPTQDKILWSKDYEFNDPRHIHIRFPWQKDLEYVPNVDRPLQKNLYMMVINDTGKLPLDEPDLDGPGAPEFYRAYSNTITLMYTTRFTWEDA